MLYVDFWEILGNYLDPDDLYNFSLTCKQANKAFNRTSLQNKISYPLTRPYKLTYEQREVIKKMEKGQIGFKLLHGDVGSGKTITSICYGIRNYNDDQKVVMCGPPSLVRMWWDSLKKFFQIDPLVLHSLNPKYNRSLYSEIKDNKFVLTSFKTFQKNYELITDELTGNDLLILDEAHHTVSVPYEKFKEIIGLSATTERNGKLSHNIRYLLDQYPSSIYKLNKSIIAKQLPPVKYFSYMVSIPVDVLNFCRTNIHYNKNGTQDLKDVPTICQILSHPIIYEWKKHKTYGLYGNIKIERKKFKVPFNVFTQKYPSNPKYHKVLEILTYVLSRKEKALLFDSSVTYLPFLFKFLKDNGINCYMFSTHYTVTSRQNQLAKFKQDDKPGVLLSSISMLGEGQNVTEANHVIFLTHGLDSTKYYQAVGRCWRYPQQRTVNVHLIFGENYDREVYKAACVPDSDFKSADWLDLLSQSDSS